MNRCIARRRHLHSRACPVISSSVLRKVAKYRLHTKILLMGAGLTMRTIFAIGNIRFQETFLPFSDPPVLETREEHLRSTQTTNPTSRDVWVSVDGTVNLTEYITSYKCSEASGLGLRMRNNL